LEIPKLLLTLQKQLREEMEDIITIPKTQVIMAFVATCIEATARLLHTSYYEVFQRMKRVGMIETFLSHKIANSNRKTHIKIVKQNKDIDKIQEIIMSNRIGAISMELAKRMNIEPVQALQLFYESQTCADLHDKSTGMYLYGDLYVADEFMREKGLLD